MFAAISKRCRIQGSTFGTADQRAQVARVHELRKLGGDLARAETRALIDELQFATPEMRAEAQDILRVATMTRRQRGVSA